MTPILLSIALVVGLITYVSEHAARRAPGSNPSSYPGTTASSHGARLLNVDAADIMQVRVRRDYWNSLVLKRGGDGSWQISEPVSEPASLSAVSRLLATIEDLPVVTTIDLPADDSERHREYGLWEPAAELTVTTGDQEHVVLFGAPTADGKGTYCAGVGRDKVYVVASDAFAIISAEPNTYREKSEAALAPTAGAPGAPGPH
jgi:hypothetical protein